MANADKSGGDWMATLPVAQGYWDVWYSEHDFSLGDGFELERDQQNEVVGVNVGGVNYHRFI